MWQRLKRWREKRQHLKTIQYSFHIFRSIYPDLNKVTQHLLVKTIKDLITDYYREYGNADGVAEFYFDRLEHIVDKYNGLSV